MLTAAKLRIYVTNVSLLTGGAEVHPSGSGWSEGMVTWQTQPAWNATVLATSSTPTAGTWLEITLPTAGISTMVYTHHPRFSSDPGVAADTSLRQMWNLMVGDVDVLLAGHQHAVEIYKKIGVTSATSSAPVLSTTGIKEFVVGTGGRSLYAFTAGATLDSNGGVAMEARDDETFGVLRMVLKPTGYDWLLLPIPGSTFHNNDAATTGSFAGTDSCT